MEAFEQCSPLGLSFCPAGDVALDLSLVYAVHGQPYHCTPDSQAPEGIALPRVNSKTIGKHFTIKQHN